MSKKGKKFSRTDVDSLAKKLEKWGESLQSEERSLLSLLIASYGECVPINQPEEIDTKKVENSMKDAIYAALQRFIGEEYRDPIINWRRRTVGKKT